MITVRPLRRARITDFVPTCAGYGLAWPRGPVSARNATRRARLVELTRKAFVQWGDASARASLVRNTPQATPSGIAESASLATHRAQRYLFLENRLAEETGLDPFCILNDISSARFSRLLSANRAR